MFEINNLAAVTSFLDDIKVEWYINAGCALYFHGLPGDLSDVDIRIRSENLTEIYEKFEAKYGKEAYLRPPLNYKFGSYDTLCIEINLDVKYDIYSKMRIIRDGLGAVNFPLDAASFRNNQAVRYEGIDLRVASLERLLVYYIVLRRNEFDMATIKRIVAHKDFDLQKFDTYLRKFEKYSEIKKIYQGFIS